MHTDKTGVITLHMLFLLGLGTAVMDVEFACSLSLLFQLCGVLQSIFL